MENIEKETASSKFMENPYIEMKKKISVNGIVALVIAILAFVGSSAVSDTQSSLKLFLIVLGAGLLIYGLIRVAVGNKIAVCRATGKVLKKYELLFEVSRLKQMVESGNFQSIDTLQRAVGHKAGAKLTLFIDADHNFATAQVSEFIPFDYEPVMSPMSYEGEVVKTIATLVTSGT